MSEKTFAKIAHKLLTETLNVREGENVTVETWNNGLPLARKVVLESKKLGACPILLLEDEEAFIEASKTLPKGRTGKMGRHEYDLLAGTNAYVFIPGPPIGSYSPRLETEELAASTAYNQSWYEAAGRAKLRGVRLSYGYIGEDFAKILGKSPKTIIDHQLKGILVDYQRLKRRGLEISKQLDDGVNTSLSVADQVLSFQLEGDVSVEDGIVDDQDITSWNNMCYMPPGIVSKQVNQSSASGTIIVSSYTLNCPVGVPDTIRLEFTDGELISWNSRFSQKRLDAVMSMIQDKDRKMTGIMIGLNPTIKFGYGVDKFVEGAVSLRVAQFRFTGVITKGTLRVGDRLLVDNGRIT